MSEDQRLPRWASAFIVAVAGLVVVGPARYYLWSDQPEDERFAWRMFSTIRLQQCELEVVAVDRQGMRSPVVVPGDIHPAWADLLRRGRRSVVRSFLSRNCAGHVLQLEASADCRGLDGVTPRRSYVLECDSQALTTESIREPSR